MMSALGYAATTAAAVAAAKAGMPHILEPYVQMIQHAASVISGVGGHR